ncbi:ABC transporter ATP-binding protein [Puniceicoccaceae bacterium K14]|nr:ABC transporter ATP-binding protein [Puniceicoccaceae bacterium K14]
MTPIIETHLLNKKYGETHALQDVSIKIPAGTIGLLGPNGAGKSTFIKCLLQLENKTSGSVSLLGMNIDEKGRETRTRIGYAPEQDCHIPGMIGSEYVTYCGELSGLPFEDARQRAHEMLDFVGMGQERYRKVDTYSTGMKQRVKIAQALVHDPDLVFLDEPTNGLDPNGQAMVLDLITRIWKESGISVILSSHLLHDVDRVCERIVIISQGELLVHDELAHLKQQRRPEVELLLVDEPAILYEAFDRLQWKWEKLNNGKVKVVHGQNSLNPLLSLLDETGVAPLGISASPNALNELFLKALDKGPSK